MSDFKRSPSRVWWGSEGLEWREAERSGSQDSGFSDTETFPPHKPSNHLNLSSNCRDKNIPEKPKLDTSSRRVSRNYTKNSTKVNRNLFSTQVCAKASYDQYSRSIKDASDVSVSRCKEDIETLCLNKSAPAVLEEIEEAVLENSLGSDCESELERLFNGGLESPKHTSTPKDGRMRGGSRRLLWSEKRCYEPLENEPIKKWKLELQQHYEPECMTIFQAKSIAAELQHKVAQVASNIITNIKNILISADTLKEEYKKLNSEKKHLGPLAQNLTGNIVHFYTRHGAVTNKVSKLSDNIKKARHQDLLKLTLDLFTLWEDYFHVVLEKEVKGLIDKLENARSELDLRASTTGVTSLCLQHESLVEIFTKNDVVPILLIWCEKSEASSVRTLLLRALSTMCCTTFAVRQFEKYSGIQTIHDILQDKRPEPEKSEATALLAQVTAPWIEGNHSIKHLQDYSCGLIKSLTKLSSTTKCCQNLLLCTAALANLATMDSKCIKYMLHLNTADALLKAVYRRGPCVSIYLLEQLATLIATMTSVEAARAHLTRLEIIPALLCFLKMGSKGGQEEAEKGLQQKAVIALSRLCGDKEAARQVVERGGVEKLIRMCREKNERFGNDAVLVATLATLRKIVDACGKQVISVEDAQELIEPKLLDSFLAYSSQSESYV